MKQNWTIQYTLMIAFVTIAIIAITAFLTGYPGRVNFTVGPNGIILELDGEDTEQP